MYCKIKKSSKLLKYKDNGQLMNDIYMNIAAHFCLMQLIENTSKSKMIDNETNKELPRKKRFIFFVTNFMHTFEDLFKQHLKILDLEK